MMYYFEENKFKSRIPYQLTQPNAFVSSNLTLLEEILVYSSEAHLVELDY